MVREVKSATIPDLDVLELPYAGDDLSMIIALPKDDIEDADKYIRRFSPKEIADLMKKRTWTCPVDVVVTGSANADDWQKFASATGGKVAP